MSRHVDSTAALVALVAACNGVSVDWAARAQSNGGTDGLPAGMSWGGHYCESCEADFDACPRTPGDHDTCPLLCADCREAAGFVCGDCAEPLPWAEHADVLCEVCQRQACADDKAERDYREAING